METLIISSTTSKLFIVNVDDIKYKDYVKYSP